MTLPEILKEFDEKFGILIKHISFVFDEVYVCKNCEHSKENHYWNGGGRQENAGYDSCRVKECKCKFLSDECDIKKIPANQVFKSFITSAFTSGKKEGVEECKEKLEGMKKVVTHSTDTKEFAKLPKFFQNQAFENNKYVHAYNQAIYDIQKKLSSPSL